MVKLKNLFKLFDKEIIRYKLLCNIYSTLFFR